MNSGYLGSIVIHGVLIAIGLSAASLAVTDSPDEPAAPGTTVMIDVGAPGGGSPGTHAGGTTVTSKTEVKFTPVKAIDSTELLEQWRRNQVEPTPLAKPTAPVRPTANRPVSTQTAHPANPPSRTSPRAPESGAPSPGGPPTLVAPTVGSDSSSVSGPGPGGPPGPSGPGSGAASSFAASVRAEFARVYVPLFREQGADIASDKDTGAVKLRVSPAGNVTFAEWVTRPSEPLLEKIVLRSIEAMRPVTPPPGGDETFVRIKFSGSVE